MKKVIGVLVLAIWLCGCSGNQDGIDRAMTLRTNLLNCNGCSFLATVTADFADKTYTCTMNCTSDNEGDITFEVIQPESIAGIKGQICADSGKLIFDDTALAFQLQNDDVISPVSAPWFVMRALRGGYLRYCTLEEAYLQLTIDDSYEDDALMIEIWIDQQNLPIQADIYENNHRILSLTIRNFQLL